MINSEGGRVPVPFSRDPRSLNNASRARLSAEAFNGFGQADRQPIIIDGVAEETAQPSQATRDNEKARPLGDRGAARGRSRRARRLGVAASLFLGLGAGFAGALLFVQHNGDARALMAANAELQHRVAALEHARNGRDAPGALAEITAETRKDRAAAASQYAQTATRLDKLEHDMSTRLQAIEKSLAARDATASIRALPTLPGAPAPLIAQQPGGKTSGKSRVPLGGWILREVRDGGALVEGATGLRKVSPGDTLPGVGRVQRVERRDGQWVLVTASGLIDMDEY